MTGVLAFKVKSAMIRQQIHKSIKMSIKFGKSSIPSSINRGWVAAWR